MQNDSSRRAVLMHGDDAFWPLYQPLDPVPGLYVYSSSVAEALPFLCLAERLSPGQHLLQHLETHLPNKSHLSILICHNVSRGLLLECNGYVPLP